MPMYADLLEANKDAPLDFVLPYDQADKDGPTETELLADELYGDGEKAPSNQRRVYLLEDHAPVLQERLGKRKRHLDTVEETDEHVDSDDDKRRPDALLLHGEPISKLGTDRIFEYVATYCDVPPTSLEWIDDRTTVIIFDSPDVAQSSLVALSKNAEPDSESLVAAHPVPKKMWPPEAQLDHNLSRGTALSGVMRVRWARYGDRKLKGARRRSEWYQEHQGRSKRSRGEDLDLDAELDEMQRRREAGDDAAALDDELDAIRRGEDDSSRLRNRLGPKKDRQIAPLPKRRGRGERSERTDRGERNERPKRTQDDLDAELDAFMKSRE